LLTRFPLSYKNETADNLSWYYYQIDSATVPSLDGSAPGKHYSRLRDSK